MRCFADRPGSSAWYRPLIAALLLVAACSAYPAPPLHIDAAATPLTCPQAFYAQQLSPPVCEYGVPYSDQQPAAADICAHLPSASGANDPCSVACDPAKLAAFLPASGCQMWTCETTDGLLFFTGGCR